MQAFNISIIGGVRKNRFIVHNVLLVLDFNINKLLNNTNQS